MVKHTQTICQQQPTNYFSIILVCLTILWSWHLYVIFHLVGNYFRKKLHLRCLVGYWIRLRVLQKLHIEVALLWSVCLFRFFELSFLHTDWINHKCDHILTCNVTIALTVGFYVFCRMVNWLFGLSVVNLIAVNVTNFGCRQIKDEVGTEVLVSRTSF